VGFSSAQYTFLDVLPESYIKGEILYNYRGTVVEALALPGGDCTVIYFKIDQKINPLGKHIQAIVSRAFTSDYTGMHSDWLDTMSVFGRGHDNKNEKQVTEEWLESLEISKISGQHHTHFRAAEVWKALNEKQRQIAHCVKSLPSDATDAFIAGFMLWVVSLNEELLEAVLRSDIMCCETVAEYLKKAKTLSVRAKSLQNIVRIDLKPIFEVDVLVNRISGSVDWQAEKEHRQTPNLARVSEQTVYQEAIKIFSRPDAHRKPPVHMEYEKFWAMRWQWSASGSIHSQYQEDMDYVSKEREYKNKFMAMIAMPEVDFDYWYQRQPELQAWSSTKYEWGKLRAIYGTDLTSYVLAHYAFYNCEDVLPNEFPVGAKANAEYVQSKVRSVLTGAFPFCLDFEDFNSQHSIPAMQAVIRAYKKVFSYRLHADQVRAVDWTHNSLERMRINDLSGTKTTFDAIGTLLSGWRLTTFMNSVLNAVYVNVMAKDLSEVKRSIHNGDDVLMGITNWEVPRKMLSRGRSMNIRVQPHKCAVGGMAEFLRIDHKSTENGQYLTRGIATLVHSRIESGLIVSPRDLVEATESRLGECIARTMDPTIAAKLREIYYDRMAPVYGLTKTDLYTIKVAHRVVGGISDDQAASVSHTITTKKMFDDEKLPMLVPGVGAFAKILCVELDLPGKVDKVSRGLYQATMKATRLSRSTIDVVPTVDIGQAVVWRGISKSYRGTIATSNLGKARLTGFAMDVLRSQENLTPISDYITGSKDPIRLLSIIA
jgi:hypothetical protein